MGNNTSSKRIHEDGMNTFKSMAQAEDQNTDFVIEFDDGIEIHMRAMEADKILYFYDLNSVLLKSIYLKNYLATYYIVSYLSSIRSNLEFYNKQKYILKIH